MSATLGLLSNGMRLPFPKSCEAMPGRLSPPRSVTAAVSPAAPPPMPWLFVGLGNPGKMYQGTRHNVGFEMIDAIAEAEGISLSSLRFKAILGKGYIGDLPIMLAKPQSFMNASGESVGSLVSYFNIPLNQVLLMYDDLDLPFAKMRLLPKGGHGGHNGMRSVISHLKGNREFPRLRIGIGRPPGKMEAANFVLRPFNKKEREELDFTFQKGVEAMRILLREGFDKSATFVNKLLTPRREYTTYSSKSPKRSSNRFWVSSDTQEVPIIFGLFVVADAPVSPTLYTIDGLPGLLYHCSARDIDLIV